MAIPQTGERILWTVASADNSAATVALAATAGVRHVVHKVIAGHDIGAASGDRPLTIAFTQEGSAVTITVPINFAVELPLDINFPEHCLVGDVNTAVTITLAASGTASNVGFVNVASSKYFVTT